jgi:hypothetical protein
MTFIDIPIRILVISYGDMCVLHWLPISGSSKLIAHFSDVNDMLDFSWFFSKILAKLAQLTLKTLNSGLKCKAKIFV